MYRNVYTPFIVIVMALLSLTAQAQVTPIKITATGTNSGGSSSSAGNGYCFAVKNNNGGQIAVTEIGCLYYTSPAVPAPYDLYYVLSSVDAAQATGTPANLTSGGWVKVGTFTVTGPAPNTQNVPFFQNLYIVVPGGDVCRFGVSFQYQFGGGTLFVPSSTATSTIFSSNGVDLLTGANTTSPSLRSGSLTLFSSAYQWIGYVIFEPGEPCKGKPGPSYVVGPSPVCPNDTFSQKCVVGIGNVLDLEYQWQFSSNGLTWNNYVGPGFNTNSIVDQITATRYYRTIIKCKNSGLYDTTPVKKVDIAPFYYCYCKSSATDTGGVDIGNLKILFVGSGSLAKIPGGDTVLNNGNAEPIFPNPTGNKTYSNFQYTGPSFDLYRDSSYQVVATQINRTSSLSAGTVAIFLDWNRDGLYDTTNERMMHKAVGDPTTGIVETTFKMPSNAAIGKTGFRAVISTVTPVLPCGSFGQGEVEDYIAEIKWEPCSGPVPAGTIEGDSSVCVGYDYLLVDSTYEKRKSAFTRTWQISGDAKSWFNIAGSLDKDTLFRVFNGQPVYYRIETVCAPSKDTTYTPDFHVNLKDGNKCYCFSQAVGGAEKDSSDIGGFSLATINHQDGSTHLQNPMAIKKRSDYTDNTPVDIDVDSTYAMKIFHTQRTEIHGDAKITVFMDFNNNHVYDIPEDRIFTGYTSVGNFTLVDSVVVKPLAILNVPTGMRVILNNDIAPNKQSDSACEVYTSGETEDYMIVFRKNGFTGIGTVADLTGLSIYPNPSTGKFMVQYNGAARGGEILLNISNITGQQVFADRYVANGTKFSKELDMSNQPKGVYFVELNFGSEKTVQKLILK